MRASLWLLVWARAQATQLHQSKAMTNSSEHQYKHTFLASDWVSQGGRWTISLHVPEGSHRVEVFDDEGRGSLAQITLSAPGFIGPDLTRPCRLLEINPSGLNGGEPFNGSVVWSVLSADGGPGD